VVFVVVSERDDDELQDRNNSRPVQPSKLEGLSLNFDVERGAPRSAENEHRPKSRKAQPKHHAATASESS
jgi:hypothetical protein